MTLSDLLAHTRTLLRDLRAPYLFSDENIVMYLNEAQERMARLTHAFVRADREIELSLGADTYPLDEDIVIVYSARIDGSGERLDASTDGWTPSDSAVSRPSRYVTDSETQTIRMYPTPDGDYTLVLRVAHLPCPLSLDSAEAKVPVKRQHVLALSDWAAYRCYNQDDADGRNDAAAEKAKGRFDRAINEAKSETYRMNTGTSMRVHGQRVK